MLGMDEPHAMGGMSYALWVTYKWHVYVSSCKGCAKSDVRKLSCYQCYIYNAIELLLIVIVFQLVWAIRAIRAML